jgi:hypothetical protein
MKNSNLTDALASANEVAKKDEQVVDAGKPEELGAEDLDMVSGGVMMEEADCKAMACGVF